MDEVLAVGDADFQKRCLGRMHEIATTGRTVLFVSHNMAAIQELCGEAICFDAGCLITQGKPRSVVHEYLSRSHTASNPEDLALWPRETRGFGEQIRISGCRVHNDSGEVGLQLLYGEAFSIVLEARAIIQVNGACFVVQICSPAGEVITGPMSADTDTYVDAQPGETVRISARFDELRLTPGRYWITASIRHGRYPLDKLRSIGSFEVLEATHDGWRPHPGAWGYVYSRPVWKVTRPLDATDAGA